MDSVNKESIKYYYDLLKTTLDKNHLNNSPGQIYNMDETGGRPQVPVLQLRIMEHFHCRLVAYLSD